jgi:putative SOS response-associated peptidase YedK
MCGCVRLSSDYFEIKIKLKFDLDAPAPNFEAYWNKLPTAPMLLAIRSEDGKRVPKMMRWGLLPHWAMRISPFRRSTLGRKTPLRSRVSRRVEARPALPRRHRWILRVEKDHGEKQPYAIAMTKGDGDRWAVVSWWEDPKSGDEVLSCTTDVRAGRNDGPAARPYAGHPR